MQGSHAIYAVSSVRNDDPLVGGPNPFADVRSLWSTEWCGAQHYTLLPSDAELPPEAVARLTVPEGSWPLHVSLSENEQAPQPSRTSPVEANLAHVQSPPKSHTTAGEPAHPAAWLASQQLAHHCEHVARRGDIVSAACSNIGWAEKEKGSCP